MAEPRDEEGAISVETLGQLFEELVVKDYSAVGLRDPELTAYVVRLLADFALVRNLRRGSGRGRQAIAAMIWESDPIHGDAASFEREAAVRRRIGDWTLFFTGMFPESLRHRGGDELLDYVAAGKESYHIVSEYERMRREFEIPDEAPPDSDAALPVLPEAAPRAPLFAQLSAEFERCMHGLNLVKSEIESFQDPIYPAVRRLLM